MVKFSIKAIFFSLIVFLLILYSGKLFLNKENVQSFRSKEYKNIIGDIDIGFFGSSHAFCSYDPRIIENELNLSAYNYGVAAQNLNSTLALAKEVIEKRNLKLGVVDIFWETLREPPFSPRISNFQLQTLDYMDFSINKVKIFNRIFGKDSLLNMFPTIREHAMWKERIFQPDYHLKKEIDYYKGFKPQLYYNKKIWENLVKEEDQNSYKQDSKFKLSQGQKKLIDEIIELFKKENVPLLFVSAPIHKKYIDIKYHNYQLLIKKYLKEKNATYIDYNDFWDELKFHLYDYKDESHLNANGALKLSQHLAQFIQKQYNIDKNFKVNKGSHINRYSILEDPKNNAIEYKKIANNNVEKETGVSDIIIYKDDYDRLEILLLGRVLNDISIKVEYNIQELISRNIVKEIRKNIKNEKYSIKEFLPNRKKEGLYEGYNFKGKEFKVLIVDCPFKEITNLSISIGKKAPKTQILKIENLEFK